jgi:hypothetical protein
VGATTANRAYPYPLFSDSVAPQDDIAALANAVDADVNTIAGRVNNNPMCVVKWSGTGTPTIATGGAPWTAWDTEVLDPLSWHDPSTNPSRITPTINGWYEVRHNFQFNGNATGRRAAPIRLNGSTLYYGDVKAAGTAANVGCIQVVELPLNGSTDYVEAYPFQDSGSSLGCGDSTSTRFSVRLLYRL